MKYRKEGDSAKNVEIEEVMDTWTLQMGYPVVTVRQNGDQVSATQQRFLFHPQGNFTEEFTSPYGLVLHFCRHILAVVTVCFVLVVICLKFYRINTDSQ